MHNAYLRRRNTAAADLFSKISPGLRREIGQNCLSRIPISNLDSFLQKSLTDLDWVETYSEMVSEEKKKRVFSFGETAAQQALEFVCLEEKLSGHNIRSPRAIIQDGKLHESEVWEVEEFQKFTNPVFFSQWLQEVHEL